MKSALEAALRGLSRRAYTHWELAKLLGGKGFSPEEIAEACERLVEWGYLDDCRYARQYAHYRAWQQTRRQLSAGLARRGVDAAIVQDVLAEVYPPEQEMENCRNMAQKLWREEMVRLDRQLARQGTFAAAGSEAEDQADEAQMLFQARVRVGRKLARRGYPAHVIRAALEDLHCPR